VFRVEDSGTPTETRGRKPGTLNTDAEARARVIASGVALVREGWTATAAAKKVAPDYPRQPVSIKHLAHLIRQSSQDDV
jgi:hypothetical protein